MMSVSVKRHQVHATFLECVHTADEGDLPYAHSRKVACTWWRLTKTPTALRNHSLLDRQRVADSMDAPTKQQELP